MAATAMEQNLVTLVNVYTVDSPDQQRLANVLVEATENVLKHKPGYVSADVRRSLDGTRFVNYAWWRSREDVEAVMENPGPGVAEHLREAEKLGVPDARPYEVAFSDGASGEQVFCDATGF